MKHRREDEERSLIRLLYDIMVALVIVIIITQFFMQNMRVVGGSMAPQLQHNNMVIINKMVYRVAKPEKNDIIVFRNKRRKKEKYVKRIVGLPGDTIDYKEHTLYVNDKPVKDTEIGKFRHKGDKDYPLIVPKDSYFVLGDNYNNSIDSRYDVIGFVKRENIIGRVGLRIWPFWINPFLK